MKPVLLPDEAKVTSILTIHPSKKEQQSLERKLKACKELYGDKLHRTISIGNPVAQKREHEQFLYELGEIND